MNQNIDTPAAYLTPKPEPEEGLHPHPLAWSKSIGRWFFLDGNKVRYVIAFGAMGPDLYRYRSRAFWMRRISSGEPGHFQTFVVEGLKDKIRPLLMTATLKKGKGEPIDVILDEETPFFTEDDLAQLVANLGESKLILEDLEIRRGTGYYQG